MKDQVPTDLQTDNIYILPKEYQDNLRDAAKIGAITLKKALEETKVN